MATRKKAPARKKAKSTRKKATSVRKKAKSTRKKAVSPRKKAAKRSPNVRWTTETIAAVEGMAASGVSRKFAASAIGCGEQTIERKFPGLFEPQKPGQRPLTIDEEQTKVAVAMASVGVPYEEIAKVIGVGVKVMRREIGDQMAIGKTRANAKVASTLFASATKRQDTVAAIWWTKTQMAWREKFEVGLGAPTDMVSAIAALAAQGELDESGEPSG